MPPVIERRGKPLKLTEEEGALLDALKETSDHVARLEFQLMEARARRDTLIRDAHRLRFLNQEIADLAGLVPSAIHYIVEKETTNG